MKKILLIENQSVQFRAYHKALSAHYEVYPGEGEPMTGLLDAVKVYLSEGYPDEVWQIASRTLEYTVRSHRFDLFIIDYKLSGSRFGKDGIWLASRLRKADPRPGHSVPVLFLSGRLKNERDISQSLLPFTKPHDWVEKGYAARRIMDPLYFTDFVMPRIRDLLREADEKMRLEHSRRFLEDPYLGMLKAPLQQILHHYEETGELLTGAMEMIERVELMVKKEDYDDQLLENWISEFNKKNKP